MITFTLKETLVSIPLVTSKQDDLHNIHWPAEISDQTEAHCMAAYSLAMP